jgi:hypothetical protein
MWRIGGLAGGPSEHPFLSCGFAAKKIKQNEYIKSQLGCKQNFRFWRNFVQKGGAGHRNFRFLAGFLADMEGNGVEHLQKIKKPEAIASRL